jgi:hypothetical protein
MQISLLLLNLIIYYISTLKMVPELVIRAEDLMVGGQLWGLGQLGGQGVDPLRHPARGSVVRLYRPEILQFRASVCVRTCVLV